ncbi:hypothetical protein [Polyangium sorediatum]|uniref:PilZ domain-containing protein n=1 Tax=Polyangium sorediatum TaxID=889274 RepID=A0ABT6NPM4_9BACT|nr:hypothetical protein [Polyangium sorediatum]MDI1430286.1 hypothetical protein [Polyangium sorediatum]
MRFPRLTADGRAALNMLDEDRRSEPPPSVRFSRAMPASWGPPRDEDHLSEPPPSVRFPRSMPEARHSSWGPPRDDEHLSEPPPSVRFPRSMPEARHSSWGPPRDDEHLSEPPPSLRFPRPLSGPPLSAPPVGLLREEEGLAEPPPSLRFPRSIAPSASASERAPGRDDEVLSEGPASVRFPRLTAEGRAALGMREDEPLGEIPGSVRFPSRRLSDMRPPRPSEAPRSADYTESPPSVRFRRVSGEAGPGYRLREGACAVALLTEGRWILPASVVRLSPSAVWFSPGDGLIPRLGGRVTAYMLSGKGAVGPVEGVVVSIEPSGPQGNVLVSVQFERVTQELGRKILGLLQELYVIGHAELARSLSRVREQIDDPGRVRAILRALIHAGSEGLLVGADVPVKAEKIEAREETRLVWRSARGWGAPPYIIDLGGYNSIHRIHLDKAEFEADGRVTTPMPTRIERVRHRWFRRCKVQRPVTASFKHPIWPEVVVSGRPVLDVSFAGLCFEVDADRDLVFPGLEMPDIEVCVGDEAPLHMHGEVRYVLPARNGAKARCGLKVAPRTSKDEGPWMRLVSQELHEKTLGGSETPESMWSLLQQSGYFNLSGKTPDQFEPLKKTFLEFGARAAAAPRIICQAVWPSERGIEASLSVAKIYSGSWLIHQLAKRPGKAPGVAHVRQILRDIYLRAFEYPQLDPAFTWALAYIDGEVPWSMAHLDFARPYVDQGLAAIRPFRLLEAQSAGTSEAISGERFDVGPAAPFEIAWLVDELGKTHTAALLDALDLVPDRVELGETARLWKEAGMGRERVFFTARRAGVPVAAAIVETGETGTNLFRLLDCVRLYEFGRGGKAAFVPLIEEARQFYRNRGKSSFVYMHEHPDGEHIERCKMLDLGPGNCWAIAAQILPEFLEHVYELTAIGRYKPKQGKE